MRYHIYSRRTPRSRWVRQGMADTESRCAFLLARWREAHATGGRPHEWAVVAHDEDQPDTLNPTALLPVTAAVPSGAPSGE